MSNTPVMDSPEVLGHALCRHVPDMRKGFTIQTRHGDIYVTTDDAAPFADAMERLLMSKIRQIQGEGSSEHDAELYQRYQVTSMAELAERYEIPKELAERLISFIKQRRLPRMPPLVFPNMLHQDEPDGDYWTQHLSKDELNLLLDAIKAEGVPENLLTPFRDGVKSPKQARRLANTYFANIAVKNVMAYHSKASSDTGPQCNMQAKVDQILQEATREDGKCLLSREEALQRLQTTSAFHTASSEPQVNEPIHQHACFAQRDCNRHKPASIEVQDGVTPRGSHEPSPLADQTRQEIPPLTSRLHVHSFCLIVPLDAYVHCLSLVPHPCSEEEKSKYHKKQGQ